MVDPALYLPGSISDGAIQTLLSSLDLPEAVSIEPLTVTAEYHSIYILSFTADAIPRIHPKVRAEADGSVSLVLRVSGDHLPHIKTTNEVAVMKWVLQHTSIPIPSIVRFDASSDNAVGHEFTLLEKVTGISVDEVYDSLDNNIKYSLVCQLARFIDELHSNTWDFVGGLQLSPDGTDVIPGPVVDETFWQIPDILKYWSPEESVASLNATGPFKSYTEFLAESMDRYVYAIEIHSSLIFMRDLIPRLQALVSLLRDENQTENLGLNKSRLVLAHKDMHFANIMFDPDTGQITGVLDWEFAGVVPASRWNPVRAFLWNGKRTPDAKKEHAAMEEVFQRICAEQGMSVLADSEVTLLQESLQKVINFVRAIVEVSPRGEKKQESMKWRQAAEEALKSFQI